MSANHTSPTNSQKAKYMKMAELLDAPGSNGSLAIGWMDCAFNQIPFPHGTHVVSETLRAINIAPWRQTLNW